MEVKQVNFSAHLQFQPYTYYRASRFGLVCGRYQVSWWVSSRQKSFQYYVLYMIILITYTSRSSVIEWASSSYFIVEVLPASLFVKDFCYSRTAKRISLGKSFTNCHSIILTSFHTGRKTQEEHGGKSALKNNGRKLYYLCWRINLLKSAKFNK